MFPYENLEVYKKAFAYNQKIYRLLKDNKNLPTYFRDQLGRASLSVQLNIAEGSGRFSNKDRRNFYVVARSSAFECSSLLQFLKTEENLPEQILTELIEVLEEISKILFKLIGNLTESN